MTKSDIRIILELFISWNDESCPIDIANLDSAVDYIAECLPSLPSNPDEVELKYLESCEYPPADQAEERMVYGAFRAGHKAGAKWALKQK